MLYKVSLRGKCLCSRERKSGFILSLSAMKENENFESFSYILLWQRHLAAICRNSLADEGGNPPHSRQIFISLERQN